MKPFDPRMLRAAHAVRLHLVVTVTCGVGATVLILTQAWLLARALSGAFHGAPAAELSGVFAALAAVIVLRALLSHAGEAAALRGAENTKSALRRRLVERVAADAAAPHSHSSARAGEVTTLATRGLDALDEYFARYLPQLVLAVLVPLAVLIVVAGADWISAAVIAVTLPLIPVFMALIGLHTRARTRRQWHLLNKLGGHFLDVVEGLPTLAVFRRATAQAAAVRRISEKHRAATMRTLRTAFLSAFALELLATIAVALVAVEIGLRLMYGMLDYQTALLVLLLAPEAYLPLREVGARFHASMEGATAAEQAFDTLDRPRPAPAERRRRHLDVERAGLRLRGVELRYPGREHAALTGVDLLLPPGTRTLLTGPSGSGKSSLLALLLRFAEPTGGRVLLEGPAGRSVPLAEVPAQEWRRHLAWVPQDPYLFDDTAADNIRLGAPEATMEQVRRAARLAEAHTFLEALPQGYATRLGERGTRLSSGQRRRLALARAFLRDAPLVLLDEPTAHLDPESAEVVRRAAARLLQGRLAVIVAHDPGWLEAGAVDRVVRLDGGRIRPPSPVEPAPRGATGTEAVPTGKLGGEEG